MTYLICPHCRYPNEIRSPYLTFCNNCSKKIDRNFQEWSKNHPGFNFEDYKQIEGVTGLLHWERENSTPIHKKTFPKTGLIVLLSVIFMTLAILLATLFLPLSETEIPSWTTLSWSEKNDALSTWETITVPEDNFEISMPARPVVDKALEESDLGNLKFSKYTVLVDRKRNEPYHYSISLLRYPPEIIHSRAISSVQSLEFMDYSVRQLVEKEKWVMIHQKEITYGLYPGKELILSDPPANSETRLRLYLVENILYTLQVRMDARTGSIRAAEKFLNSFKLLTYAEGGN